MSPAEMAIVAKAKQSAEMVPAAEANRRWARSGPAAAGTSMSNGGTNSAASGAEGVADIVVTASKHAIADVRSFTDAEFNSIHQRAVAGNWDPEVENAAVHHEAHTLGVRRMVGGGTSMMLSFMPVLGFGQSVIQFSTGKDIITGEPSDAAGNAIGIASSVLPGMGVVTRRLGGAAERTALSPATNVADGLRLRNQLMS
jgi:hypothetical protein